VSLEDWADNLFETPITTIIKIIVVLFIFGGIISILGYGAWWAGNAGQVAQEQFSPKVLLQKYEWFKDASAQLDKKIADIGVYKGRLTSMKTSYGNQTRSQWARSDREQYNIWSSEVAGVIASYNSLAADYNSEMAKFNWRFTNVGDLPQGATVPLPREYKPYIDTFYD
jgi:hypothetical protein